MAVLKHGFLNPFQIVGIVDMPHEVDVAWNDPDLWSWGIALLMAYITVSRCKWRARVAIPSGPAARGPARRRRRPSCRPRHRAGRAIAVLHRAARIDDVGHIAFAVLVDRGRHRLERTGEHLRRVLLVEQRRADRIFPHRADAVGEQAASLRRARSASRNCRSGPAPTDTGSSSVSPSSQRSIGSDFRRKSLAVLPADHRIAPSIWRGNSARPLLRAAAPVIGTRSKQWKSRVRISSERIPRPE